MGLDAPYDDHKENDDLEMVIIPTSSDDDELKVENNAHRYMESEYVERTLAPHKVTKHTYVANDDLYRTAVRRQNCCFGTSMLTITGLFVAAYVLMGLSFTPSNIGIFGDESSMKGGSGKLEYWFGLNFIKIPAFCANAEVKILASTSVEKNTLFFFVYL